jgi:hypothetical protein
MSNNQAVPFKVGQKVAFPFYNQMEMALHVYIGPIQQLSGNMAEVLIQRTDSQTTDRINCSVWTFQSKLVLVD